MKFTVYYADRSTYSGEGEEDAMEAPTKAAQITKLEVPEILRGFSLRHGSDFHCWQDGRWGGKDRDGMIDYILHHKGPMKILMGREIHDQLYQDICKQAVADGCFCEGECSHYEDSPRRRKGE